MTGLLGVPDKARTVPLPDEAATRLVLVRHGEAACNVAGVVGGTRGCRGLTDLGRQQVDALARRLGASGELRAATAFYSSVLPRAVETAELISSEVGPGNLVLERRCDLCELHPGRSDGLAWAQAIERFGEPDWDSDPTRPLAPGGESWSSFVARAAAAVEELVRRHPGELVVVASHAGVVEATLLSWMTVGRSRLQLRTTHASITEWEHGHRGWRLLRYNDAAHLACRS
ncbi:MAG: histidine phosphatase family protein [Actinomycetota bacterium]|jgi:probable phosphoglycerate mutase|nr:histidine phosphatase family protein [Actinomycetota bacterium]